MARFRPLLLACCLAGLIVGVRWAWYDHYGTDLPESDQWDGEGTMLLQPSFLGQLYFRQFFVPHNEHRIVLTRFIAFGLTVANGQWDQRLEAAVNALLPAAIAAGFWLMAARRLSPPWRVAFFLFLAAVYLLPVAAQNLLAGFSSAQYFLTGLALAALATLPFAVPYRPAWWLGSSAVILSLGSLASGFFVAGLVAAMLAVQVLRGDRPLQSAFPAWAVCILAVAAGVATRTIVAGHEQLKAHSVVDFAVAAAKSLGWPAFEFGWGAASLVLLLPWVMVTWRLVRPRGDGTPPGSDRWNQFLAGAGFWMLLQVLAAAYTRGVGGSSPPSRYVDTILVGSIVNFLCLHSLGRESDLSRPRRDLLAILACGWIFLFGLGLVAETDRALEQEMSGLPAFHRGCEQHVRDYLATRDEAYLRHPDIPYPAEWALKSDLEQQGLVTRLPVSVRAPLELRPAEGPPARGGWDRIDGRVPEREALGVRPPPVLLNAVTWSSIGAAGPGVSTKALKASATGGHGQTEWKSAPLGVRRGSWLKFEVAGDVGHSGNALELRDGASGRTMATIQPPSAPGPARGTTPVSALSTVPGPMAVPALSDPDRLGWRTVLVRAPDGPFFVFARDNPASGGFAFSEPVEMSGGSYWAWQAVHHGLWLAGAAGVLALAVAFTPRKPA